MLHRQTTAVLPNCSEASSTWDFNPFGLRRGTHRFGHLAPLPAGPLLLRKQKEIVVRLPAPLRGTRAWGQTTNAPFSTKTFIFSLVFKPQYLNKLLCHYDQRNFYTLKGRFWCVFVHLPFLKCPDKTDIRSSDSSLVLLKSSSVLNIVFKGHC